MRIGVNAAVYDHRPSGLGTYTRELVAALHAIHSDLIVYTSRPGELPAAAPIRPWGEPSRGLAGHLYRLAWTQTSLAVRARLHEVRILLNTVPEGPLLSPVPQVTVVHDILPLFFPGEFPRQQWYLRAFVPAVLRASAAVIADSAQTKADIEARYGLPADRILVVSPGVNHDRFRPRPEAAAEVAPLGLGTYLLFVGNLRPHKNLHRLLEAFARVSGGVTLVVAGYHDPRYWPSLARRVHDLHLAARVKFLDFVEGRLLPALYAASRAVVMPSLYEGFGLPVLEAMACGTPVVASRIGSVREAAGEAAWLVDPQDVGALAGAMQRIVDDEALRAELRARGLARARAFTWDATARGVLAVMTEVVK